MYASLFHVFFPVPIAVPCVRRDHPGRSSPGPASHGMAVFFIFHKPELFGSIFKCQFIFKSPIMIQF